MPDPTPAPDDCHVCDAIAANRVEIGRPLPDPILMCGRHWSRYLALTLGPFGMEPYATPVHLNETGRAEPRPWSRP